MAEQPPTDGSLSGKTAIDEFDMYFGVNPIVRDKPSSEVISGSVEGRPAKLQAEAGYDLPD